MKEKERDILAEKPELKKMPYSTPEGYFEGFKTQMKPYESRRSRRTFIPYISAAASLALLVAAGFLFSQRTSNDFEMTQEDYLVFSTDMSTAEYYEYTSEQYAAAQMADDDIINYLIYSGITAEELEHYK